MPLKPPAPDETPIQSEVAVPLIVGEVEQVLGVLRIQSDQLTAFPPADRNFLQSLGQLLAATMTHHRRIEQLENDLQEINILYNLQRQNDPEQVFEQTYVDSQILEEEPEELSAVARLALAQRNAVIGVGELGQELATPIQVHGEQIGVLGLSGGGENEAWSEEDRRLLEEVSDQVALALENARLIQQTQARSRELALLNAASRQLSETVDPAHIYAILTEHMVTYLRADRGQLLLLDEEQASLVGQEALLREDEDKLVSQKAHRKVSFNDKTLGTLLAEIDPVVEYITTEQSTDDVASRYHVYQSAGIYSIATFPLMVRNQIVGILEIGHRQAERQYRPNELQLARTLISQVVVAVENALQFQKTQDALVETEQQTERLAQLNQMSQELSLIQNEAEIFNVAARQATQIFSGDRGSITLLDESGEQFTVLALQGNEAIPVGVKLPVDGTLVGAAIHQNQILIASDFNDEQLQHFEDLRLLSQQGLQSSMVAPLLVEGRAIGTINVANKMKNTYTTYYEELLGQMASHLAGAIENRKLFEVVRRERDQAEQLHEIDQRLNQASTIEEVQQIILSFTQRLGASHGEVCLTDGMDFARLASTIPTRQHQHFSDAGVMLQAHISPQLEPQALEKRETIVRTCDELDLSAWPALAVTQCVISTPFQARHSDLQGVITYFHAEADAFASEQIQMVESIANQAAAISDNLWLLKQTATALSETELLYGVTRDFSMAQQPEELLQSLANSLLIGAEDDVDSMAIGLFSGLDDGVQQLEIAARWYQVNDNPADVFDTTLTPDRYGFLPMLKSEENVVLKVETFDPTTQQNVRENFAEARTMLAIPLRVSHTWLGVLFLISHKLDHKFKLTIVNRGTTLASQIAVVLRNLQLVEETQQTLFYSETLSNLSQELLVADTAQVMYELALETASVPGSDWGSVILVEEQGELALKCPPEFSHPDLDLAQAVPFVTTILEMLSVTGRPLVAPHVNDDERLSEPLRQWLISIDLYSFVAAPIWLKKGVAGFILVGQTQPQLFAADALRLYEDVAQRLSVALENQALFEEAQHRATLLQTAAEVSEAATGFLELETLLNQAVDLMRDRFGFYHVSIFLVDEYEQYAMIKASTGEVGQKMLAMKHKLAVGGRSIVGTATATRKPHIALDVGQDGVHFNNPLLPETRSEMALPLVARGKIIGALDVQSRRKNAFAENEITILQSMANQLANAIAAALASQETQQTLEHMQKLNEYYLREQWGNFIREQQKNLGYQLQGGNLIDRKEDLKLLEIEGSLDVKEPLLIPHDSNKKVRKTSDFTTDDTNFIQLHLTPADEEHAQEPAYLRAPLSVQDGVIIGALDFEITAIDRTWEEDQLRIVEAVTAQAAQAIETARLFEQTQTAREEAEALYQVSRTLVTAESEQQMYVTVLEKMLQTLGLRQGGVLFFDQDREYGTLQALFENGRPVQAGQRIPIAGNASYSRLIETKKPLPIEDVMTDPLVETVRDINQARNVASLLLVPIVADDEVVGAVGADSVGEKHNFTEWEISLASAITDQLSIILQNRRLLEATYHQTLQLLTIADVSRVATSILNQEEMLDQAVELIKVRFGFYHVQIFLVDERKRYTLLYKSTGDVGQKLLALNYKINIGSQGLIGQVTAKRESRVIRGTHSVDFDQSVYRQYLPDTQAELAIPLQVGERLIGILDVHSEQADAFSEGDIATMELLASQIAIAIQNAQAFKEQQETAERLKEVDKLKTQFLANMSHELRTPLNSIIGFSRVILKGIDGPLTELQKTDLTSIHNSGQHLLGLINNILDLSKIEAGKMELNFEEVEVEPIIKGVMATALALVKDKPVELKQELEEDLPIVWADPTRIRQIILNLVSNACKFTEKGAVTLQAKSDNKKLMISVIDTGIGIPEDQREGIFEEFTQVDASTTRKVGGTGLGLPISRHFVEMHKGQIWVEAAPDRGAVFKFTIPLSPDDIVTDTLDSLIMEDTSLLEGQNKTVVAIDDDPDVVNMYERYLEAQGYTVVGITNGENIIDQIKAVNPAAILLDILMPPNNDGWSIIQQLKKDVDTENVPVIICSMLSEQKRGFSLGAADYLTKPITEGDLLKALLHLDNREKEQVKVAVIDDEADDILLIRRILEAQPNYIILEANNGKEGVELVTRESPDLIILDLTMPEMDGFSVVETLKDNDLTRGIPIIIVSAKDLTSKENKFLTGQVEALLRKDLFTEDELLEDVRQALTHIHHKEAIRI